MDLERHTRENRRSPRIRRSEAMLWRLSWFEDFEMGWLLESSDTGCAFAWRGVLLPSVGSRIDINTDATLNGVPIGTVHVDPWVFNVAYVFKF